MPLDLSPIRLALESAIQYIDANPQFPWNTLETNRQLLFIEQLAEDARRRLRVTARIALKLDPKDFEKPARKTNRINRS